LSAANVERGGETKWKNIRNAPTGGCHRKKLFFFLRRFAATCENFIFYFLAVKILNF